MSDKKIYFMGLLANTDSSILDVELDNGFSIKSISESECFDFISNLDGLPYSDFVIKLHSHYRCLNSSEGKFYVVSNSIDTDVNNDDVGISTNLTSNIPEFNHNLIQGYLNPVIQAMRLFKEGNICMPLSYYYSIDNNIPKRLERHNTNFHISHEQYTLDDSEISNLQRFIKEIKLPFKKSFLQLAFENFELSYQIHNTSISFLSLMISLETLFHPADKQELIYRISRNAAVLLGKTGKCEKSSNDINSDIKKLYDKRSKIIHTGKSNIVNQDDLLKLRGYVRDAIIRIDKIDKTKDDLLYLLHSSGFDQLQENIET